MQININNCDICGSNIQKEKKIFRAYDSTLCSENCRVKKYKIITNIDPAYNKPDSWQFTNTMTRTKSELCIEISDSKSPCSTIYNNDKTEEKDILYTPIYRTDKEYNPYIQTYNGIKFLYILGSSISIYSVKYFFSA